MGFVHHHVKNKNPNPTRIIWGSVAGFLLVSMIVVFMLVRWKRTQRYHPVPVEALADDLIASEGQVYIRSPNYLRQSLGGSPTVYCDAGSSNGPVRLSNAFSDIPDFDSSSMLGRSWKSVSISSHSTQIMSGAWKTSLRPTFFKKPMGHYLRQPKAEAALTKNNPSSSKSPMEIKSQKAEVIHSPALSLNWEPEQVSTVTNPISYLPSSSPFLEELQSNYFSNPSSTNLATVGGSEEVEFYSAARLQPLQEDTLIAIRVLPLRPLPLLPQCPRPLPKPPCRN